MHRSTKLLVLIGLACGVTIGWASASHVRAMARAKAEQAEACRDLVHSEVVIWTLEDACLRDAMRVLGSEQARRIAEGAEGQRDPWEIEQRLRQFLRIRRAPDVWEQTREGFVTFTPDSRAATNEAAMKAGLRPVDIMAEWMTYEGAVDFYLMTKVHDDPRSLPESATAVATTFFAAGAPAPTIEHGIKIVSSAEDRITIDLFGARVPEEWVRDQPVQVLPEGEATVPWRSNYNTFRDSLRSRDVPEVQPFTLVRTDEGFGVDYRPYLDEYREGGDRQPWATTMCRKGPLAVGALYEEVEAAERAKAGGGK